MKKALSKAIASLPQKLKASGQNAIEGRLIPHRGVDHKPSAVSGFGYLLNVFRSVTDKADVERRGLFGGQRRGEPCFYLAWARSLGHHG